MNINTERDGSHLLNIISEYGKPLYAAYRQEDGSIKGETASVEALTTFTMDDINNLPGIWQIAIAGKSNSEIKS